MRVGDVLVDRFELVAQLGEGGMGRVFKARDRELERYIAIKALLPQFQSDARARREMITEVNLSQHLSHPAIVQVFDFRVHGDIPFIQMEFVEGEGLDRLTQRLPGGRFDEARFRGIAVRILDGVQHAHGRGVVHRDLKPGNVFVTGSGNVKILDYGIAATIRQVVARLTGNNSFTPHYASPEQINGEPPSVSMDIYSLGCVFYHMVAGHPPFLEGNVAAHQLASAPRPPHGVSSEISALILRCLEKHPSRRFATAGEMLQALGVSTRPEPDGVRPPDPAPREPNRARTGAEGRGSSARAAVASLEKVWLILVGTGEGWDLSRIPELQSVGGQVLVGRSCPGYSEGLRVPDESRTMSRRQAYLVREAGGLCLRNLAEAPANPTSINGRQLGCEEQVALRPGDQILMGQVQLQFRVVG